MMAKKDKTKGERYTSWLEELKDFQESDFDQREMARECDSFLLDPDGQWEERVRHSLDAANRPRYTFDKITPVIETMMADIENMEIGCNVKPAGGEADKDVASTIEGMIRAIQNMSGTESMYRKSARRIIRRGFDAWIVKARYKDEWSFDQDLFVESIPNAINRVWVSNDCSKEDSSDASSAYVLSSMSPAAYKERWPDGSGKSVDSMDYDDTNSSYQPEVITIAERYYRKENEIEVGLLSNGNVVELNDDWDKISDEQALAGVTLVRQKKIKNFKWYYCAFDGGGILEDEKETVFTSCPVVTVYGNHEITGSASKVTYSGITMKEMDAQRVHNYAKSREIEEGALSPRAKWWMTPKQADGHADQLSKMNTSSDPVQFWNADEQAPPPFHGGGPAINQGLVTLGAQMSIDIKEQALVSDAMQGQFNGRQSEDSVRMQIDRGTAATRKWVNALVNGVQRVCDLLIQAIPVVYDTEQQFAILGEDGTEEMVILNQEVYDRQTQSMVKVNTLNAGKYKVTAGAGPAFSNKLEAGLRAMLEYAALDPSIVTEGGDLMLRAIDAPMVDKMADRKRSRMVEAGLIPFDQMTKEEQQQAQQLAQQPKQADPMMVAAQAEMAKAQADMADAQNKKDANVIDSFEAETKRMEVMIKAEEVGVKIENVKVDTQGKQIDNLNKVVDNEGKKIDNLKKRFETIK